MLRFVVNAAVDLPGARPLERLLQHALTCGCPAPSGTPDTGPGPASTSETSQNVCRAPPQRRHYQRQQRTQWHCFSTAAAGAGGWGAASEAESRELLQRFNIGAVPGLRNHLILARVVKVNRQELLVDPGYYGLVRVSLKDLGSTQTFAADGSPILRAHDAAGVPTSDAISNLGAASGIQPGEYVRLRLTRYYTPYGDPQLEPVSVSKEVRDKLVWRELRARMSSGRPVTGRILNSCQGGYAVGVAGYVALLRHGQGSVERVSRIGSLQPFYVHRMDERSRSLELSNFSGRRSGGSASGGIANTIYSNI